MISTWLPFALSPSTWLRIGLSKPAVSFVEPGERHFFCLLLMFLVFSPHPSLAFAQAIGGIPHVKQPPLVRIVGAFASLEDPQRSALQTLIVHCKEHTWRMRIREIKALTATTNTGWGLLKDLFPPKLRLTGPDELIALLQQEDIAGKPFVLEGRLYVGDHMLYLTAVTVNEP
jgi:hypothetical protein